MDLISQPKVFIGERIELNVIAKEENWNPQKIIVITQASDLYKLHGIILKRGDVFYGVSILRMDTDVLFELAEMLRVIYAKNA